MFPVVILFAFWNFSPVFARSLKRSCCVTSREHESTICRGASVLLTLLAPKGLKICLPVVTGQNMPSVQSVCLNDAEKGIILISKYNGGVKHHSAILTGGLVRTEATVRQTEQGAGRGRPFGPAALDNHYPHPLSKALNPIACSKLPSWSPDHHVGKRGYEKTAPRMQSGWKKNRGVDLWTVCISITSNAGLCPF